MASIILFRVLQFSVQAHGPNPNNRHFAFRSRSGTAPPQDGIAPHRPERWLSALCVAAVCFGCGGGGGSAGGAATGTQPITSTCSLTVTGDASSGVGTSTYESTGYGAADPYNAAAAVTTGVGSGASISIICANKETTDGSTVSTAFNLVFPSPITQLTVSDSTTNYSLFELSHTSPEGSFACLGSPASMVTSGTFNFKISSVLGSYRHDPNSVTFYDIRASGHADCPTASRSKPGSVGIDITF